MLDLVKLNKDNKATTTSKIIADVFGKTHAHVMRDIQNLEIPEDFGKSNFGLSSFHAGTRDYPMYEMTRDGFTLLAMGFTGKKAMEWKIKFIEAFNALEANVKQNLIVPSLTQDRKTLKAIGGIVKSVVHAEINKIFECEKIEPWEVSDQDLLYQLHCWHATRNKADIDKMRELLAENADLKNRMSQISNWVR